MSPVSPERAAAPRPATPEDSVLGVQPGAAFEPESVEEAAAAMGQCARDGLRVGFIGGGTELGLGVRPERLDAVIRTRRLARIVEHAPSDQIVIAEAGVTLASLQTAVATHRQRLALDPPLPERATIGGIVATSAFGPRRMRYGSVRDIIIGISMIRADGTAARGGGKVVKNVAGFDLPKLMCGSLGTLGMIATATFRLHPLPEASETLRLTGATAGDVRGLVARIKAAQLEPTSLVAVARADAPNFEIGVRFEGFRAGVVEQRDRFVALLRQEGRVSCELLDEPAERAFWAAHDRLRTEPLFCAKIAALPAAVEAVAGEIAPALTETLGQAGFLWYPTLGLGFVAGAPRDAQRVASGVGRARERLAVLGGSLVLHRAPAEVRALVEVWGPPPPALTLMRSVKERLDPERRLNPGRFVGGI